jgi:LacI family transcriptional regulator
MSKITIKEVAKKAGVSTTTVSRVMNGNDEGHMKVETKQKILKVIEELNYIPNKHARSIRSKKTGIIGVIIPDISNPFFSLMVRGIQLVTMQKQFSLIICDSMNSLKKEVICLETLLKERVDGVILVSSGIVNHEVEKLVNEGIRIVLADRKLKNADLSFVGSDALYDGNLITKYLINIGYTEIGFIKGPTQTSTNNKRFEAYIRTMEKYGLPINKSYIFQGDSTFDDGFRIGINLIEKLKKLPQALIVSNDIMAIGVTRAFEEKGIEIPKEIGISSFDNIFSYMKPTLTTVHIPAKEIGKEAASLLINDLKRKKSKKESKFVETKLVIGQTTKQIE